MTKKTAQLSLDPEGSSVANVASQTSGETPAPAAGQATRSAQVSFEDAIQRLSEIVEKLESDGLGLEESLTLFEEGVRLAKKSQTRLETAERKVHELLGFDENGKPIVDDIETD